VFALHQACCLAGSLKAKLALHSATACKGPALCMACHLSITARGTCVDTVWSTQLSVCFTQAVVANHLSPQFLHSLPHNCVLVVCTCMHVFSGVPRAPSAGPASWAWWTTANQCVTALFSHLPCRLCWLFAWCLLPVFCFQSPVSWTVCCLSAAFSCLSVD
jgi:hypothetical protein